MLIPLSAAKNCGKYESTGGRFYCVDEDDTPARLSESEARRLIQEYAGAENTSAEFLVPRLRCMGLSLRQISKYTGISLGIVRKY